ncbi:MAG: hypothetical protein KKC20_24670 [Proteobacteria bacterium]|nr:hypothetical protein [Pseudomonadota bacterium]
MRKAVQYTVIIPTMYFHNEKLQRMLDVYTANPLIYEILLVNNNKIPENNLSSLKLRKIGLGINLYVNPSWRLGASLADTENIILANDDILIKGDLEELLVKINEVGLEGKVFGPSANCYRSKGLYEGDIVIEAGKTPKMNHGYGTFLILTKTTFLKTYIPKDIKVWFGDMILYEKWNAYTFKGVEIETAFAGTTSKIDLKGRMELEKRAYYKMKV